MLCAAHRPPFFASLQSRPLPFSTLQAVTLAFLLLLALVSGIATWRGHRITGRTITATALGLLLVAGCGPLPHWLLGLVQPPPSASTTAIDWSSTPAIIVIGAGLTAAPGHETPTLPVWTGGRLLRAAEIYRECVLEPRPCTVVLSGGGPVSAFPVTEADLMAEQLLLLGVRQSDLVLERASQNTWQNAELTARLLAQRGIQGRPLLLTSALHAARARAYFLAAGVDVQAVATDHLSAEMTWIPSALNVAITDLALHEIVGQARLSVYSYLGLNG